MLKVVGKLGKLTNDCSKPTVTFPKRLWFGEDVGPFKVSGLALAAESLRQAFAEVQELDPDLFCRTAHRGTAVRTRAPHESVALLEAQLGHGDDLFCGGGMVLRRRVLR